MEKAKEYFAQVILIVFSVVLGLYLNKKIDNYNDNKEAIKIFELIKSEIKENEAILSDWHPYHQSTVKNVDSLVSSDLFLEAFFNEKEVFFGSVFTRGTFMGRFPSHNAWEISKSNPLIANIGYENLLLLSKVYDQQGQVFIPIKELFELYNSKNFNNKEVAVKNLGIMRDHLYEIAAREEQLIYYYEQAFTKFDIKK